MEVIKTHFIADLCSINLQREKINCSLKMQKNENHTSTEAACSNYGGARHDF